MHRRKINMAYFETILSPITGMADDDLALEKYGDIDSNSEKEVKEFLHKVVASHYHSLDDETQTAAKIAFQIALQDDSFDYDRFYDSLLPPFDLPAGNSKLFFLWLWQVLFPNEPIKSSDCIDYDIYYDPNLAIAKYR